MKRFTDIAAALVGLIVAAPVLLMAMFLVWLQDGHSPLYHAPRVGRNGVPFRMVKIRSMVMHADRTGVDSTAANDQRITSVGRFIRRYKLDEFSQLWNVLRGDMSLVGPRPQVQSGVDRYTEGERRLLSVQPGITDFASIVFADEGEILEGRPDPDLAYDQLIRPWKSRLGLFYIDHQSVRLDLRLVALTATTLVSRRAALQGITELLSRLRADPTLISVASRTATLTPTAPPGSDRFVDTV